ETMPFAHSMIKVQEDALNDLAGGVHFTVMTYARLLIGDLLPREIDRVLYLDGDILVRGDIGELWTTDLRDRTLGAVVDLPPYPYNRRLGLPDDTSYFNAGVLLIDLRRWRQLRVGERALSFAREHPERLAWADQCALNLVLHDDWRALDRVWNLQSMDVARLVNGHMRFDTVDPGQLRAARLVHFNGRSKPWHYLNDPPFKPNICGTGVARPGRCCASRTAILATSRGNICFATRRACCRPTATCARASAAGVECDD